MVTKTEEKPDAVVVRSRIKEQLSDADIRMGSDCWPRIDGLVADVIGQAVNRAKANGRKTLQPQDF